MHWVCLVTVLFLSGLASSLAFADSPSTYSFKELNPDVDKYNFAKSYITSLSYYNRVVERLALEDKAVLQGKPDHDRIKAFIDHRTLDNTELRIACNYLTKYTSSSNALIKKVALETASTYDALLEMSAKERELWQSFWVYKTTHKPSDFNEDEFERQQILLARDKKEIGKELTKHSLLMKHVLLSAERCAQDECRELALTQDERERLVQKLDTFAKGNMEWGVKPGQSTITSCVAALREVLEDSQYQSKP